MLSSEGKAAALQTVGLAAAGGNSPHVFAIRENKKKEWKERRGGGGRKGGGAVREVAWRTWRPDVSADEEESLWVAL